LLILAALLLAAGCASQENSDTAASAPATKTLSTIPTRSVPLTTLPVVTRSTEPDTVPDTPAIEESESLSESVIAQPGNSHPEYIRMDATIYKAGDVVEFYLVNRGPEITGCSYTHPTYTIYRLFRDGTREKVSSEDPDRSYLTVISGDEIASSTGPFTISTASLIPGRYLIRFDCGNNVAREFILYAKSPLT
jgi:hypothetical protein